MYTLVAFEIVKAIQAAMQGSFYMALDQRQRERERERRLWLQTQPSEEGYLVSPTDTLPVTLQVL